MINTILFDMDGVLVDSERAIRTACMMMFRELGVEAAHEDFIPFTGMGENRFIGGVAEKYGITYELPMKARAYEIYGEIVDEYIVVYEGIRELISELKQRGYRVAIASATDAVKVHMNLRCMGFSPSDFDALVTGDDVSHHKPNPECYQLAAQKVGAKPEECLVVEDAVAGCKAARAAGMRCVAVLTSFDSDSLTQAGAFATVAKTQDLPGVLDRL